MMVSISESIGFLKEALDRENIQLTGIVVGKNELHAFENAYDGSDYSFLSDDKDVSVHDGVEVTEVV